MEGKACSEPTQKKKSSTSKKREKLAELSPQSQSSLSLPNPGDPSPQLFPLGVEGMEDEPLSCPNKAKPKSKSPRRVKGSNSLVEEDIIDGFSFLGFRALADLEAHVNNSVNHKKARPCSLGKVMSLETLGGVTGLDSSPTSAHQVGLVSCLKTETAATCTPTSAMLDARTTPTIAETVTRPPPSPPPIISPVKPSSKSSAKRDGSACKKKKSMCSSDKVLPSLSVETKGLVDNSEAMDASKLPSSLPTPPPSKNGSSISGSSDCSSTASKDELDLSSSAHDVDVDAPPLTSSSSLSSSSSSSSSADGGVRVVSGSSLSDKTQETVTGAPTSRSAGGGEASSYSTTSSSASSRESNCQVASSQSGHHHRAACSSSPLQAIPTPPASNRSSPCSHHHHLHNHHHNHRQNHATGSSSPATQKLSVPPTSTVTSVPSSVAATTTVTSTLCISHITTSVRTTSTTSSTKPSSSCSTNPRLPNNSKLPSPHQTPTPRSSSSNIHRDPPKPIPGLSGTRYPPEDKKDPKISPVVRDRSPSWHCSPGARSSASSHLHKSSHHLPAAAATSSHPLHPHPRPVSASPHLPTPAPSSHHTSSLSLHHPSPHPAVGLPPPPPTPHPLPHSMYGPQIAPPPPSLSSAGLHVPYSQQEALAAVAANSDSLSRAQHELNSRFLQDRGLAPSALPPPSPAAAAAAAAYNLHQHNHMHQHQHMHQHFGSLPGGVSLPTASSLIPPTAPHLKPHPQTMLAAPPHSITDPDRDRSKLDKIMGKYDSPFARQSLALPGLQPGSGFTGLPPMIHPSGLTATLGTGAPGAFLPKVTGPSSSSMHHTQLLMSLDQRKSVAAAAAAAAVPPSPNHSVKKPGKWCAAHVRVAWEIHLHQQKQQPTDGQRGSSDSKAPADPLRPPSHLFPTANPLHRPSTSDLSASSLLRPGAHSRSPFETSPHSHAASFLTPGALGVPPFPRPAPYPNLGTLGNNAFGGLGNIGSSPFGPRADLPSIPGLSPAHEWNRLHRTPPSFPTPPTWPPKSEIDRDVSGRTSRDSRDASRDRERDLERDREILREKEKDRERELRDKDRLRERSASRGSPNCLPRTPNQSHDFHKLDTRRDSERSRSRSRSPLRNGPLELARSNSSSSLSKSEGMYSGRSSSGDVRVKEERRDDLMAIDDLRRHDLRNDKDLKAEPHKNNSLVPPGYGALFGNPMLDHRLFGLYPPPHTSSLPPADRLSHPSRLWNPFDPSNHRAELERDREKEHILRRLGEDHIAREQQELLLRHQMMQDRERLALLEKERLHAMEGSKLVPPPLRPAVDPPSYIGSLYPPVSSQGGRPPSPHLNHNSKSNSPASSVGAPPPLISSSTTGGSTSHSSSPSIKTKAASSPLVSGGETNSIPEKNDIANTPNGHDADLQSR